MLDLVSGETLFGGACGKDCNLVELMQSSESAFDWVIRNASEPRAQREWNAKHPPNEFPMR